jgi:hypothetical protein
MPILSAELVVDLRKHGTLQDAERALYLAFRRLKRRARRYFGRFEYLTFVEISQRGWPRLLLLVRGADVPRRWLAENWTECGGARISNVRWLHSLRDAIDALQPYQFPRCRESGHSRRRARFSARFFEDFLQDVLVARWDMAYWSDYRVKFGARFGPSQYRWRVLFVEALRLARDRGRAGERKTTLNRRSS